MGIGTLRRHRKPVTVVASTVVAVDAPEAGTPSAEEQAVLDAQAAAAQTRDASTDQLNESAEQGEHDSGTQVENPETSDAPPVDAQAEALKAQHDLEEAQKAAQKAELDAAERPAEDAGVAAWRIFHIKHSGATDEEAKALNKVQIQALYAK
jgi:hypothetical protein